MRIPLGPGQVGFRSIWVIQKESGWFVGRREAIFDLSGFPSVWRGLVLSLVLASNAIAGEPSVAESAVVSAPGCEPGAGVEAARQVQARYDGIRDLRADFEQVSQSVTFAGAPLMDSEPKSGRVVFAKPGKMRWTYGDPEPSVVVSDGQTLWIHDVEGGTATRLEVTAGYLSGAALQFLLGDGNLLEEFHVTATACTAERVDLELLPKKDASYERLGLVAGRESGDIEATSVVDLFGNRTEIRFEAVEINQSPDASVFEFQVPEGVELIDYAGAASDAAP